VIHIWFWDWRWWYVVAIGRVLRRIVKRGHPDPSGGYRWSNGQAYDEFNHLRKRWRYRMKVFLRARLVYHLPKDGGVIRYLEDLEEDLDREEEEK
jgi:hypothetical protein